MLGPSERGFGHVSSFLVFYVCIIELSLHCDDDQRWLDSRMGQPVLIKRFICCRNLKPLRGHTLDGWLGIGVDWMYGARNTLLPEVHLLRPTYR